MGFTAQHELRGRLDATQPDLGCGWAWESVHRVRPRVAITCPECKHPVHAKVSRYGLRFFAHDPGSPTCALAGESAEHHLLKLELATAIRAAGHYAELEVRGPDGTWRADVMASSADGTRRMAWEAQLSPITAEEITERTARFAKHGVQVCWVGTKLRPWVGQVPSIHVLPPEDGRPNWTVAGGLTRFTVEHCDECGLGKAVGHGVWEEATTDLCSFIAWVLAGRAVPVRRRFYANQHDWEGVWTAPQYIQAAAAFALAEEEAEAEFERRARRHEIERLRHEAQRRAERDSYYSSAQTIPTPRLPLPQDSTSTTSAHEPVWEIDLPGKERDRLHAAVVAQARLLHGVDVELRHRDGDRRWALGLPMFVGSRPYGVLRPRPEYVDWNQLEGLAIFVRNRDELRLLGRTAPNGTFIFVVPDVI